MEDWEGIADWYDGKQGDSGDLWHKTIIDPTLLRVIGECHGKEVLDLGCGNGYLSRRLAKDGAKVTAVDASARMIRNAKAHDPKDSFGIRYMCSDGGKLLGIPNAKFDLIIANMSLMDIEEAEGAIKEVSRVLKDGGRFVASICHPCFDIMSHSSWVSEEPPGGPQVVYRKVRGYREPFFEEVPWNLGRNQTTYTKSYHRPLSWYARTLSSHHLAITSLEEPEPTTEYYEEKRRNPGGLDSAGLPEVPLHLVIEAVKL